MGGICLDPQNGYVFVTYASWDENRVLRNNISRFQSEPGSFSVRPASRIDFTDVFKDDQAAASHQIGGCQVHDGLLYVGIGDGLTTQQSQSLDSLLGKIVRLTLDGEPAAGNPFADAGQDQRSVADYIWALGLRNPFGLKVVDGHVFVNDNGLAVDRFVEVHAGQNYLWDGTDWSIGAKATAVFGPAVSPVQMDYYKSEMEFFPSKYDSNFFVAFSGAPIDQEPGRAGDNSIVNFHYDFESGKLSGPPRVFLRYVGEGHQMIVGLGLGTDGLYFVPIFPDESGETRIYKVIPGQNYPVNLTQSDPDLLILKYGCRGCHWIAGSGNDVAPSLRPELLVPRVLSRLGSDRYRQAVAALPVEHWADYPNSEKAIDEISKLEGLEKARAWVAQQIERPGFDQAQSQMPDLGVSGPEARTISDHIAREGPSTWTRIGRPLGRLIGPVRLRHVIYGYVFGAVSAILICAALAVVWRRRRLAARR